MRIKELLKDYLRKRLAFAVVPMEERQEAFRKACMSFLLKLEEDIQASELKLSALNVRIDALERSLDACEEP